MISPQFVIAGRAVFTVQNNNNQHYTFRVNRKDESNVYFVSLLTGSDRYTYMGMFNLSNHTCTLTRNSKFNETSIPVRVFDFAMRIIDGKQALPEGYSIQHEGMCGKCCRPLTDPESIRVSLGPICRSYS